ncbi:MAG TPA: MBL fold metallo-hydrolase [Bryobacteraceae bacterium]|nr:MBL fold metallo-hydrolase [Bryobacteraceae bacterium]
MSRTLKTYSMKMYSLVVLSIASLAAATPGTLDIYWIDVEGGGATLIVTPAGESLLADTGNPGERDPGRIVDVATKQAGLKKLDYLLITHFDGDHVGGASAVAKMIPVSHFLDHGDTISTVARDLQIFDGYKAAAEGKRQSLKPGDKVPMKGVSMEIVTSNGAVLAKALPGGGPNPLCATAQNKASDETENRRTMGFLLSLGKFKFLDLGDLTWETEMQLACPVNKIGTVTLFQATHHGFFGDRSGAPAFVGAIKPQILLVNNGATKGWHPGAWNTVAAIPGVEAIWQVHLAVNSDKDHNTKEDRIANLEAPPAGGGPGAPAAGTDKGYWIKASVSRDGSFTITNSRNNHSETYKAR